jgi:hypothetical protein
MFSHFGDVTWILTDIRVFLLCLAMEIFPNNFHRTFLCKSDILRLQ